MTNPYFANRSAVMALRARIERAFPSAHLSAVQDELELAIAGFTVVLRNKVVLCVSNDPGAFPLFQVLRAAGGPAHALAFEARYEDRCGVNERLAATRVLQLLADYGARGIAARRERMDRGLPTSPR